MPCTCSFIAWLFLVLCDQLPKNKFCNKIKQNIYFIAAFILFFAHEITAMLIVAASHVYLLQIFLLHHNASSIGVVDRSGNTALHWAALNGHDSVGRIHLCNVILYTDAALHPSGVAKSSTSFSWGKGGKGGR